MYDFNQIYNGINSDALFEAWPEMSANLTKAMSTKYQAKQFKTMWPQEIEQFLIFIRLLPFKPTGQSKEKAELFANAIKRLIVFAKVLVDFIKIFTVMRS